MKVMVTGGTGFIGGHTLAALVAASHEPRVLVRDPDKLGRVLAMHDLPPVDHVVGDITDPGSVQEALEGADACLHAAAVTALKRSEAERIAAVNVTGGRTVLDAAVAAGCDPVLHLSTVSAVFPPRGPMLSAEDPVTEPDGPYSASKAQIDRHARSLQEAGAPVVIVYPGGTVGPDDAGVNVLADGMSRMLNFGYLAFPQRGGNTWVDVRDLARALVRLLDVGDRPARYMAGGNFVTWDEFIAMLQRLTGGEYTVERPTNEDLKEYGRQNDIQAAETGEDPPLDYESAVYMCDAVPTDDAALLEVTGLRWRPAEDSWRDMLRWCAQQGLLSPERGAPLLEGADGAA